MAEADDKRAIRQPARDFSCVMGQGWESTLAGSRSEAELSCFAPFTAMTLFLHMEERLDLSFTRLRNFTPTRLPRIAPPLAVMDATQEQFPPV